MRVKYTYVKVTYREHKSSDDICGEAAVIFRITMANTEDVINSGNEEEETPT